LELKNLIFDAGMRYVADFECDASDDVSTVELQIVSVSFTAGNTVTEFKPHKKIYFYEAFEPERYKDQPFVEKIKKYSPHAVCFSEKRPDGWLCTCGRLNRFRDDKCLECLSDRKDILKYCTKEAVKDELKKDGDYFKQKMQIMAEEQKKVILKENLIILFWLIVFTATFLALFVLLML